MLWWWGLLLSVGLAASEPTPATQERTGWGFGAVPAVNFNSDEGVGFGVGASLYRYDGQRSPYRTAIDLMIFSTSRGIHTHGLQVDTLDLGGLPLRLMVRGELRVTRTHSYCGVGGRVDCALPDPPPLDADPARWALNRFVYPNIRADLRYTLDPMPHTLELLVGWRGGLVLSGDLAERGPFPGSRYAQDFPDGERERISVLQLGLMLDNRDHEAAPHRGYWIEGTIRGAAPALGATFAYFGFNTTLRGYLPLAPGLVLADRVVVDGQLGDPPILEQGNPGGSQRYELYGSLDAGRGIRLRRYIGKAIGMNQTELRWTFADTRIAQVPVAVGLVGFVDVGVVAADWEHLDELMHPRVGQGGGLRLAIDRNFVLRADLAVSAVEGWTPSTYIDLRNTF